MNDVIELTISEIAKIISLIRKLLWLYTVSKVCSNLWLKNCRKNVKFRNHSKIISLQNAMALRSTQKY